MKRFWIILLIIVAVCALLFAITYNVPQVKALSEELVKQKMPIWLVGLLAPIIYLFRGIGKGFSNIFPKSGEEEKIKKENERILTELDRINSDVQRLDQWRKQEIDSQMKQIESLKRSVLLLSEASKKIDSDIAKIKAADPSSFSEGMSNKEVFDELDRKLMFQ